MSRHDALLRLAGILGSHLSFKSRVEERLADSKAGDDSYGKQHRRWARQSTEHWTGGVEGCDSLWRVATRLHNKGSLFADCDVRAPLLHHDLSGLVRSGIIKAGARLALPPPPPPASAAPGSSSSKAAGNGPAATTAAVGDAVPMEEGAAERVVAEEPEPVINVDGKIHVGVAR